MTDREKPTSRSCLPFPTKSKNKAEPAKKQVQLIFSPANQEQLQEKAKARLPDFSYEAIY